MCDRARKVRYLELVRHSIRNNTHPPASIRMGSAGSWTRFVDHNGSVRGAKSVVVIGMLFKGISTWLELLMSNEHCPQKLNKHTEHRHEKLACDISLFFFFSSSIEIALRANFLHRGNTKDLLKLQLDNKGAAIVLSLTAMITC